MQQNRKGKKKMEKVREMKLTPHDYSTIYILLKGVIRENNEVICELKKDNNRYATHTINWYNDRLKEILGKVKKLKD